MSKRRRSLRAAAPQRSKVADVFVPRPFEGLADEPDWIALRELVPAASAPLRLSAEMTDRFGERPVTLATVLPMAQPAMSRSDGRIFLGLQRHVHSGDPSRDLAVALTCALETPPGEAVSIPPLPGAGPRLQDLLDGAGLDVTVHDGFEFWLEDGTTDDPNVAASLERANTSAYPTVKLDAARAAYWCQVSQRAHVRWVLAEDEDAALHALSRLSAAGGLTLGETTRFAGMFRAYGRLVPVWDLPREAAAATWEAPLADFAERYAEAASGGEPLTAPERRARQGLLGRQQTLR